MKLRWLLGLNHVQLGTNLVDGVDLDKSFQSCA